MNTDYDSRPPGGPSGGSSRGPLGGLTRSTDDKVISGLCGGLGRHLGIDPLVLRIAFVVMSMVGGTGILLYLIGWAVIPDDRGATIAARWTSSDRGRKLLAVGLAGIGLLLLVDRMTDGHGDDFPLAVVLIGLGALVLWSRRNGSTPTVLPPGSPPPPAYVPPPPTPAPPVPPVVPTDREPGESSEASESVEADADADAPETSDPTTPPGAGSSAWWETTAVTAPMAAPPVTPPVYRDGKPPKPPKAPKPRRPPSALVPVTFCLLAILAGGVALAGADVVTGLALALFLVAGALVVGAFRGRARALIPLALLLSGALFVASLIDVPFRGGAGQRIYHPASVADVRSPYRLVAGEIVLDLGQVDVAGGRTVPVVASVAAGHLVVTVPADVTVDIDAHVGAGEILIFGRLWDGVGVDQEMVAAAGREGSGRINLDAQVGFGQVEVRRAAA